jgi:succinate-semialdehyde dehydrogenase/glutarate-semialdehyde dehydrogenase
MPLVSVNPSTGEQVGSYDEMNGGEVERALSQASAASASWRATSFDQRAALLKRLAVELRLRKPAFARLMALEMGKPVAQGESEVDKCALTCDFFADHGAPWLADEEVTTDARRSFVAYRPLGVVLGVMPWNFPFWQVFRYAAPTIMAGNTTVLKHASNVTACALAIEDVFRTAGAPDGVFQTLRLGSARVGDLIDDRRIAAVTLTGSTPAGRAVAARAGQALKKLVLELGGSDPYLILDDADIAKAVDICVSARLINSGQSCVSAKRFIVTKNRAAEVERLFVEIMAAKRMGDPIAEVVDVGPQARPDLRDELHKQVVTSIAGGARTLLGGTSPDGPGAFYPPTILTDVRKGMPAYDEELFGPVAAIIIVDDEAQAIATANDSPYGLGAAVFTNDIERGTRIAAQELDAGACFVNTFVRSDPRLPFGGIKESGYGRELGMWGIREFVNVKTVYVA